MMSNKIGLTLDEEFRMYTATLMNNWFALKLLINHSEDSVQARNSKVEELFDLLINSVQGIMYSNVEFMDCVDHLEDYIDLKFNTYIEDNSCEEVLNELLNYYNLLLDDKREELSSVIHNLKEKRSIFSDNEYNPDLIVRVTTPHQISHPHICAENNVSMEQSTEMPDSTRTERDGDQPDDEWETVSHRRNKNK